MLHLWISNLHIIDTLGEHDEKSIQVHIAQEKKCPEWSGVSTGLETIYNVFPSDANPILTFLRACIWKYIKTWYL